VYGDPAADSAANTITIISFASAEKTEMKDAQGRADG